MSQNNGLPRGHEDRDTATPAPPPAPSPVGAGLSTDAAQKRLKVDGPNAVSDSTQHPLGRALSKLWAPIPWMLEAAVLLQIILGEYFEAAAIGFLLHFNAGLGFLQEGRA